MDLGLLRLLLFFALCPDIHIFVILYFNLVNWRNLEKLEKSRRIGEIQQTFNISLVLKAASFSVLKILP